MIRTILTAGALAAGMACLAAAQQAPTLRHRVVNTFPHDIRAFTQGLAYHDGYLYEGTGNYGRSSVRKVEIETGKVLQRTDLPARYFGEGITIFGEKLIQITWQTRIAFVYDLRTLKQTGSFVYPTEGWGLTHDGKRLIMSDGSATLYFRDPLTFRETGRLEVREGRESLPNLNELEFVKGEIWANVWQSERIARISPRTGQVLSWVGLQGLRDQVLRENPYADVLNGIAWDPRRDRLFVTGKWWTKLFEIQVVK